MMPWSLAGAVLLALVVTLAGTLLCERLAVLTGALAHPREDRWHRASVPMLGGIAIILSVVVVAAVTWPRLSRFGPLLMLAVAMGGLGLVDDVKTLRAGAKLVAQIGAAAALIGFGTVLPLTPWAPINVCLTLLWVVAITNAFNLLDNMDGLAGGVAALAACFRLALFFTEGDREGVWMMATLFGAIAGFLIRNVPPAKIFMGDTGSLFLGFFLSGTSLVGDGDSTRGAVAVLVVPLLIVLVPIVDTVFVTVTRLLAGRSIVRGGRDHLSHRLVAQGLSERQALTVLLGISTISGLLAVLSYRQDVRYSVVLVGVLLVGLVLLAIHLGRVQVGRNETLPRQPPP